MADEVLTDWEDMVSAALLVADMNAIVDSYRKRIAKLQNAGKLTLDDVKILEVLEGSLEIFKEHQRSLRGTIRTMH
jgi:hypothetical protein